MTDLELFDLAHSQIIINKVTTEMMQVAHYMAILNGGSPTSNQKAFALQAFLNPAAHVEPFIWGCVLNAAVQSAGTAVADSVIFGLVGSLWPVLWA